jgi:hypothetical protein
MPNYLDLFSGNYSVTNSPLNTLNIDPSGFTGDVNEFDNLAEDIVLAVLDSLIDLINSVLGTLGLPLLPQAQVVIQDAATFLNGLGFGKDIEEFSLVAQLVRAFGGVVVTGTVTDIETVFGLINLVDDSFQIMFGELNPGSADFDPQAAATTFLNLVVDLADEGSELLAAVESLVAKGIGEASQILTVPTFTNFLSDAISALGRTGENALDFAAALEAIPGGNVSGALVNATLAGADITGEITADLISGVLTLDNIPSLTTAFHGTVDGSLIEGALANATLAGADITGSIAADLISGELALGNIPQLAITQITDLETLVSGFSTSSSILSQLITLFGNAAESGLSGLSGLGGIFSDLTEFVGSPTGLGSGHPTSSTTPADIPVLSGLFSGGTFLTSFIPDLSADLITSGTLAAGLVNGALANATLAGADITGEIAADLISGALANATIAGADITGEIAADLISGVLSLANIPDLNAAIITSGTLASSLIEGIEGAGTTLAGDVTSIVEGAGATTAAGAGTIISDASGAITDATNVISGAVTTAATSFGGAIGGALGSLLGLNGAPALSATSAQLQAAAAAVAAARAAQAQETAAINAQLPKFYGGSGTSGLNAQVSLSGSLPSSFTQSQVSTAAVAFDAVGSGGLTNAGPTTDEGSHNATAGAEVLAYTLGNGTTNTVTYGGTSMSLIGSIAIGTGIQGVPISLSLFTLSDVPGGEQVIVVTNNGLENMFFGTFSYTGVGSVGTPFTVDGDGTSLSQSITCAAHQLISQAFGAENILTADTGGTQRFLTSLGSPINGNGFAVQDASASTTFAATSSVSGPLAGMGVVLSPPSPTIAKFAALLNETADTDQETVSGIWSSPITVNGGARYLFLRVNSGFSTYLFVKWFATGTTSAPVFNVSLGCVVAGVEHVFTTFTESTAATAQALINASVNNNISLEATADAIQFTYPQGASTVNASIAFSDTSGVSQIGATFRNAGFGTDESPVVFPASFAFFDSGPTVGPQASPIITPQTSVSANPTGAQTTTSTTFAKLPTTTDQVTVNIGPSGIALVFLTCSTNNSGAGQANYVGFSMSGENTAAASFSQALEYQCFSASTSSGAPNGMFPVTGLTPGATTFEMEYAVTGGTGTFWNRRIFVLPI